MNRIGSCSNLFLLFLIWFFWKQNVKHVLYSRVCWEGCFQLWGNQISSLETQMCIMWTQKHLDKKDHHLLLDLSSKSSEGLEEGLVFRLYGCTSLDVLEGHVQFAKLLEGLTSSVQSLDVGGIHIDSCNWSEETDFF